MKSLFYVASFFLFCVFTSLQASEYQFIKDGPIHEAFVIQEYGNVILQPVPDAPPPRITEEMMATQDNKAIWIPGYWSWIREIGDYIWVSGVWRRPPPGQHWIPGYWKKYPGGWVWFRGFWSKTFKSELEYIPQPPPDLVEDKAPPPPQPANAYYWVLGCWEWDKKTQSYQWFAGRWEMFNEHWVYVPAQYYWREEGYLFVPGFWDWPIEKRGTAFADAAISKQAREYLVLEPTEVLNPLYIMERLFPYWPNYISLFRYHFYFHNDEWIAWGVTPPWWKWYSWWCFPIYDAWWLWWWWTHPGYPNPPWIDSSIAEKIQPPSDFVLEMMKRVRPPAIVTGNGVIGGKELIKAIERATGKKQPILPSDPKQVIQIEELAKPQTPKPPYLRPSGKTRAESKKPSANHGLPETKLPPGRVKMPSYPTEEQIQEPLARIFHQRAHEKFELTFVPQQQNLLPQPKQQHPMPPPTLHEQPPTQEQMEASPLPEGRTNTFNSEYVTPETQQQMFNSKGFVTTPPPREYQTQELMQYSNQQMNQPPPPGEYQTQEPMQNPNQQMNQLPPPGEYQTQESMQYSNQQMNQLPPPENIKLRSRCSIPINR